MTLVWLAIGIILLMLELLTSYILVIFFAIAAFLTSLVSIIVEDAATQMMIFFIISFMGIIFGRNILLKYFKVNKDVKLSNIDAMIGKKAIVLETVTNDNYGLVKVDGEVWSAKLYSNKIVYKGDIVIIKGVEGVKLLVEFEEKK